MEKDYGSLDATVRRTHKDIKCKENAYNPIIQMFTDPSQELRYKTLERDRLHDTIANNKVLAPSLRSRTHHSTAGPAAPLRANV